MVTVAEPSPPPAPIDVTTPVYTNDFASSPVYTAGYPDVMVDVVCGQGFTWDCGKALRVAWCEMGSKWNPEAINPSSGTRGVFQIHPTYHAHKWPDFWDSWMEPYRNAQMAHDIYLTSGWGPWACQ